MRKRSYLLLAVLLLMVAVVTVFRISMRETRGLAQSGAFLPNPNGYDDFLKAGQLVTIPKAPGTNSSAEELRALLTPNTEVLKLVRAGLNHECRMPISFSPEYYVDTNQVIALECKALDMVLESDGRLAELEHRTNDALKTYLEAIRFSHECSRGGFKINAVVGQHCEAANLGRLRQLMVGLDAGQCREAIKTLETLETKREPIADVLSRDKKWWHDHSSLHEQMASIPALAKDPSLNPMNISPEDLEQKHQGTTAAGAATDH